MMRSAQGLYSEMLVVKQFMELDKKLLAYANENLPELLKVKGLKSKEGTMLFKKMLKYFENKTAEKILVKYPYLKGFISGHILYRSYLATAIIMAENCGCSSEEELFRVCNEGKFDISLLEPKKMPEKYEDLLIYSWKDRSVMFMETYPSRLLLPINYLKQAGYQGKIEDKKIYNRVKADYGQYARWLKNFRLLTESEFRGEITKLFGEIDFSGERP